METFKVRWSAPGSVIGTPVSYRDPCVSSNQLSPSIRARSRTLPGMILTCHGGVAFYCVDCSPRMQTELRRQGADRPLADPPLSPLTTPLSQGTTSCPCPSTMLLPALPPSYSLSAKCDHWLQGSSCLTSGDGSFQGVATTMFHNNTLISTC
nr:uncharacterized protein LOC133618800 isoform X4 [Nerophis lumbriciformis]